MRVASGGRGKFWKFHMSTKTCPDCGRSFSINSYARHLRSHFAGTHICAECHRTFKNSYGLERHVREQHESTKSFACPVCGQRFARRERLDAHRARMHLDAAHEALQIQLSESRKQLENARASVARLQAETDRLNSLVADLERADASDDDDREDAGGDSAPQLSKARRGAPRCACKRFDSARLGDVRCCSAPGCHNAFHWSCAGYGLPLTRDAYALCGGCLCKGPFKLEEIEEAHYEIIRLDAYLASRCLRREPVPADGFCLFAAVARVTGHAADDLFHDTMVTLITHDFTLHDPTIDATDQTKLRQEAASHAARRLRMSGRWDSRLLDFAAITLMQRFNLACFEVNGRTIREDPVNHVRVGGRICCYGRGVRMDPYDAVLPV